MSPHDRRRLPGLACAAVMLTLLDLTGQSWAAYSRVRIDPLPAPGTTYCSPFNVVNLDEQGRVAGNSLCYGPGLSTTRATLWENGEATDLGLGGPRSDAIGGNGAGVIVGGAMVPANAYHAFVYQGGVMHDLGIPPGYTASWARGVDGSATTIVGGAEVTNAVPPVVVPVVWNSGVPTTIPLQGNYGYPLAVDNAGRVLVNDSQTDSDCESLRLWSSAADLTIVPCLEGFDADAAHMSSSGIIVGTLDNRPVRFVSGGGAVDLGSLPGELFYALGGVNDAGVAVGHTFLPVSSPAGAFVLTAVVYIGGQALNLAETASLPKSSTSSTGSTIAHAINNRGQIVVGVFDGSSLDGAFLLTPVCGDGPDPGQPCDDANSNDRDGCKNDCTPNVCGDDVVRDGIEQCDDGNAVAGDGCEPDCRLTPETVSAMAPPGGTVGTNAGLGGVATPSNPLATAVTTPAGGMVTIAETGSSVPPPSGYALLGTVVNISAPPATVADPLRVEFRLDASLIPPNEAATTLTVFRNGVPAVDCPGGLAGGADPSPCVGLRETLADGDAHLVVLTVAASQWVLGITTSCGNGTLDPGEQCDDGNRENGDCCGADCTFEPIGTVCRAASGPCDVPESCTGASGSCPADLFLPDGDQDGICDPVDPCTNGSALDGAVLKIAKLGAPNGDETFRLRGVAPVPTALDPVTTGVRVLLADDSGTSLLDRTVPGGMFDPVTKSGWKVRGTSWRWKGSVAGLSSVTLKLTTDGLKVSINGKGMSLAPPGSLPLEATTVFSPPRASGTACAVSHFTTCAQGRDAAKVSCKQ